MKIRSFGALALIGLAALLMLARMAGARHSQRGASIKIGVSLAGYSTDFWSSYVAFEKAAARKYGVSLVGPISSDGDAGKQATQIRTLIAFLFLAGVSTTSDLMGNLVYQLLSDGRSYEMVVRDPSLAAAAWKLPSATTASKQRN